MTSKASPASKASTLLVRLVQLVALAKLERLALLLTLALLVRLALLVAPRWTLTQQEAASVRAERATSCCYLSHTRCIVPHTPETHIPERPETHTTEHSRNVHRKGIQVETEAERRLTKCRLIFSVLASIAISS